MIFRVARSWNLHSVYYWTEIRKIDSLNPILKVKSLFSKFKFFILKFRHNLHIVNFLSLYIHMHNILLILRIHLVIISVKITSVNIYWSFLTQIYRWKFAKILFSELSLAVNFVFWVAAHIRKIFIETEDNCLYFIKKIEEAKIMSLLSLPYHPRLSYSS